MMTNLVRDFENKFSARAALIDSGYRKHRAEILADRLLSEEGRAAALARADTARSEGVQRLRGESAIWVKFEIADAHKDLAAARASSADKRRKVLGDGLTADLARRRLALLSPAEMSAAIETAADDWHKVLYGELVDLELRERANGGDVAARTALADFGGVVPAEIVELELSLAEFERDGETLWADLDVTAWRSKIGDVFGVNPEFMPTGETGRA